MSNTKRILDIETLHSDPLIDIIKILNDNNINVYSIKTDALTIDKNDIKKVKKL